MICPLLPLYERSNIDFSYGMGPYLFSKDGKKYLDFAAGYAALSLGHCHPKLVDILSEQAKKLWHLSNRHKIPGLLEYCKRLTNLSFADTVFIANSGAEAVECMIKMARRYFNAKGESNRYRFITIDGAFHGRTLACISAGSAEKIKGFEPSVDGFDRIPFNDLLAFERAITDKTAGILLELVQGEGGMRAHSDEFIKNMEIICKTKGLLVLVDEVQSGMGRTGHMFAYEKYNIKPDLMALGKGLGSGFPISACLATEKVGKHMLEGTHGSTFGGNPLAVAIGHGVLDCLTEKDFLKNVNQTASYLKEKLELLILKYPYHIESITGCGLMLGIKFKEHINMSQLTDMCLSEQFISNPASGNVLRITPPLIINQSHCDEAIEKLHKAIGKLDNLTSIVKYKVKKTIKKIKKIIGSSI